MKGFGIYVQNDLLEPKHYKKMGESVWLYMWLLDKITSVNENGEGKVLGGKPITYQEFQAEVGVHKNTYSRYLIRLRDNGYINTVRTPRGMVIVVNKAKKGITRSSDSPKRVIPSIRASESPDRVIAEESPYVGFQYKTKQSRLNKTKQTNTSTDVDMAGLKTFFYVLVTNLGFSDSVKFTDGRKLKLKARLKTYKADELLKASESIGSDAFLQGDNPQGKRYGDIDYLLRSDEQIDKQLQKIVQKINYKADW